MSADPEQEYFCDGLAEELLNALAKLEDLKVAARTSAFSFKGKNADLCEIGHKLNVSTVLEGSVRKSGQRLRITAQLVNVADGYHLWSERYERELEDVFEIQDEISLAIVDALKVKLLGREKAALLKRYTNSPEAHQAYLKGRYYWNSRTPQSMLKAIECLNQARELDPNYALPYAGLADCYALLGMYGGMRPHDGMPKAREVAIKALQLDDNLAEAHTSLAMVRGQYEWDFPAAERELKRAMEVNPGYAFAREVYGRYLAVLGRFDESIAELKKSEQVDPLSLGVILAMALPYTYSCEDDKAIEQCKKAVELYPNEVTAHNNLGFAYAQKGMFEDAVQEFEQSLALLGRYPAALAGLGYAYAAMGNRDAASEKLEELIGMSKQTYIPATQITLVYMGLGEMDKAFEWLERACEERTGLLISVKVWPLYDSLRQDARFDKVMQRVGFWNVTEQD